MTFEEFSTMNQARCINSYHTKINDWSLTDWATALAGECGEACNVIKHMRRGEDVPLEDLENEIADVVIYADLLAARIGANLETIIRRKFNETSKKIGSKIML